MDICSSEPGWKMRRRKDQTRRRPANRILLTPPAQQGPRGPTRNPLEPLPPGLTLARREKRAGPHDLRGTRQVGEAGGPRQVTMEEKDGEQSPLSTPLLRLYPHRTLQPPCQVQPLCHTLRPQQRDAQHLRPCHHTHQHQREESKLSRWFKLAPHQGEQRAPRREVRARDNPSRRRSLS